MCGIIGIASATPVPQRAWLAAGRDAMRHRGPDDFGEWWSDDGRIGLAHRRLAVIDLTPSGHQPMADASGELRVVFNGEIYNFLHLRRELLAEGHVFRSESDTEVILAAYRHWGTDCVAHLQGMFVFALFDARSDELFVARDRAGEKPLFYSHARGSLRFASELKGLMADQTVPRAIDPEALDCYLTMGFVPGDRCLLQGMRKLPPAHALMFNVARGELRVWRYWNLPRFDTAAENGEDALLYELESLMADAVRRQLVADVPVGVLLSGGVDSSLVTAMAARAAPRVKTFTMRFGGHGRFDETEHARLIAQHFGTQHTELDAGEASVDMLPMLARQFDEPIVDSSMIPTYLVSRLTREHCTVALGGDGGDELFGGYLHYSRMLRLERSFGGVPHALRAAVAAGAGALLPVGLKGRSWLQALGADFDTSLPWIASHFDAQARRRLMRADGAWPLVAEGIRQRAMPRAPDLLQRASRSDFENYMVEDILVKVDRASMLNSLEVRAPLLDHRLVEFAFAKVPASLKATTTDRKILLKKLAARVLPRQFDSQRKQGFSAPLDAWLREKSWRDYFREVLLGVSDAPLCKREVGDLLDGQGKGRANSERLLALLMLELWRREYRVAI